MFLPKLQQFSLAFILIFTAVPAATRPASASSDLLMKHIEDYERTGDLEYLCLAYGENKKRLSLNGNDPQANLIEAHIRDEGLHYDFDSIGGFRSPPTEVLVGNCPYGRNFNDIAPHPSTIMPDTYYSQPLVYYLEQARKGGFVHPEFFSFYVRVLLDINDSAKAVEITQLGIKNAPRDSNPDSIAELYFQLGIANTRLMEQATQSMSSSRTPLIDIPLIGDIGGLRRDSVDDVTFYYGKAKQAIEQSLKLREHDDVRDYLQYLEQQAEVLGVS